MRVFDLVTSIPWAIEPEWLRAILGVAGREAANPEQIVADLEAVAARKGKPLPAAATATVRDGVAIIPVAGPIFRYANLFTELSGATSVSMLANDLRAAQDDPTVRAILLAIDSPGGEVNGINELANMIRDSAKPVTAYVSYLGSSAAYWLASAAGTIVVDATAQLGSIGVVMTFVDRSKADAARGYREIAFVSSQSPAKRPSPDDETGRATIQGRVDAMAQVFIDAVAKFRGVAADKVVSDLGRGSVLIGAEAVAAGMADRLGSFEALVAELAAGAPSNVFVSPAAQTRAADAGVLSAGPKPDEVTMTTKTADQGGAASATPAKTEPDAAAIAAVRAEAAAAERARIKAINDATIPGHEALAAAAIEKGDTAEQFALAQSMAEKNRGKEYTEQRRAAVEKQPKTDPSAPPQPAAAAKADAAAVPETDEAAKQAYAGSAALQAEFLSEAGYVAYCKAKRQNRFKVHAPDAKVPA